MAEQVDRICDVEKGIIIAIRGYITEGQDGAKQYIQCCDDICNIQSQVSVTVTTQKSGTCIYDTIAIDVEARVVGDIREV